MIASAKKKSWTVQNQQQIAEFFERSIQAIAQWRRRGMPGRPGKYDIREILKWALGEGLLSPTEKQDTNGNQGLERQRMVKAELLEMELQQKKKTLVPREQLRTQLGLLAAMLRQASDRLGKRYGPDASMSVNELLEDYARVVANEFGGNGDVSGELARGTDVVHQPGQDSANTTDQSVG